MGWRTLSRSLLVPLLVAASSPALGGERTLQVTATTSNAVTPRSHASGSGLRGRVSAGPQNSAWGYAAAHFTHLLVYKERNDSHSKSPLPPREGRGG